ncbi:hypothetical protein HY407_00520 [Candidatus Gottesmanbacteria bacterium]|nr:hypothetical protein [Candidatus Gottesmanbacteria bacterium]
MTEVIPAILEKSFPEIERKIHLVENYVHWVQIDIADGTLVDNNTYIETDRYNTFHLSGGTDTPPISTLNFELHMMVKKPLKYLDSYMEVGFKRFFAHVEGDQVEDFILKCQEADVEVGLAIDGPTPWEKIHPYLDNIDALLVMAIEAGESGKPYREDTGEKIRKIKEIDFDLPIAVDGAMNEENARKVVAAGATRINSNSYIFKSPDVKAAIETLKQL